MQRTTRETTSFWIGLALGLAALVGIACFVIFLPHDDAEDGDRTSDDAAAAADESSQEPLELPDRVDGGFVASDLPEAFTDSDFADRAEEIAGNEAKNREYADQVLGAVLDEVIATRVYAGTGASSRVSVKAFRSEGGAFAPVDLPDPSSVPPGQPTTQFLRQDGAACSVTTGPSGGTGTGPAPAELPTDATCQQSRDGVTVQASAQSLPLSEITALLGAVLDELT